MTNYEKLVETLRWTANEYKGSIMDEYDKDTMNAAADAIEALEKQIDSIENEKTNLEADIINLEIAIDKANTQLPKRGKWIGVSPTVDTVQCSVCGGQLFSEELETPYCPYCGAKMMEVQAVSPWRRVEEKLPDLLQFVVVCNDEGKCVVAQYVGYQTDSMTPWRIAYTMYDTDIYDETECGPVCYWMPIEPPKGDA